MEVLVELNNFYNYFSTSQTIRSPNSGKGNCVFFSLPECPTWKWGPTQPAVQWVAEAHSPCGKAAGLYEWSTTLI